MDSIAFDIGVVMFTVAVFLIWITLRRDTPVKPPASRGFINEQGRFEEWVD
jgi:hypothetical protein